MRAWVCLGEVSGVVAVACACACACVCLCLHGCVSVLQYAAGLNALLGRVGVSVSVYVLGGLWMVWLCPEGRAVAAFSDRSTRYPTLPYPTLPSRPSFTA